MRFFRRKPSTPWDEVKHRIVIIGDVCVEGEGLMVRDWKFGMKFDWLPHDTFDVPNIHETFAGWKVYELHDIAHGYPCDCGVDEVLRNHGLLEEK